MSLAASLRMEISAIVDQHNLLILDMEDEIFMAILVTDLAGDRGKVLTIAEEDRTHIDAGTRGIAARNLDDFYMTIKIEQNKMRRILRAIIMTHHGIHLEGAGATVVDIGLIELPPGEQAAESEQQHDSDGHARTDRQW